MAFLQDVIRAIRDLRSRYTISPHARLQAHIRAAASPAATLQASTNFLLTMAGLESVHISPDARRAPDAATAVVGPVEIYLPGVIDVTRERTRLQKQREQLLSRLTGSRRKLANADFLKKASPEVVQKERDRLAECETELENVETTLTALG
jgi:valyl-tRNA synthetase